MGHLRMKANICSYKEKGRRLKKCINDINDGDMMTKIIRDLTTIKTIMKSSVIKFCDGLEESRCKEPGRQY